MGRYDPDRACLSVLAALAGSFDAAPLSRELGMRCVELGRGAAVVAMAVGSDVRHPNGSIPGVLIGALAERSASLARATVAPSTGPAGISVRFMRSATDAPLEARAEMAGGAAGELAQVAICCPNGELVASATVTWHRDELASETVFELESKSTEKE